MPGADTHVWRFLGLLGPRARGPPGAGARFARPAAPLSLRFVCPFSPLAGSRVNTLCSPTDEAIVLISENLGFTYAYLRQLWMRICRGSMSFETARDDPDFQLSSSKYDVVTDGNQPLKRSLADGEQTSKRLPGRPVTNKRKTKSRCMAVKAVSANEQVG